MLFMNANANTHASCAAFQNIVIALGTVILAVLLCAALIEAVVAVKVIIISLIIVLTASIPYSRSRANGFAA